MPTDQKPPPTNDSTPPIMVVDSQSAPWPELVAELVATIQAQKAENGALRRVIASHCRPDTNLPGVGVVRFDLNGTTHRTIVIPHHDGTVITVEV